MLNYKIHDNNSTNWVVFLHGIGGSTETWKKQIGAFKEYNLLLIDLPGHGKSECHEKITIKGVNESIKEVLDHLHIIKADFVTLSLGTLVAAHFAVKYPTYVGSIIMGGAVIKVEGIYKVLMQTIQVIKRFLPHRLLFNVMAKIMLPKKNHKKSRKIFIRESLKMTRKMFLSWVSYIAEITNPDKLLKKLKELHVKMFFISGDEDRCFLDGTKKVVAYLSKPKLYIIKKCGHVCSIEKYNEFNTEAVGFLNTYHTPVAVGA
jgi:pimeloyl-ACP methyl ester carboxylesterase